MSGLFKHKILILLIIFSVVYWNTNPPHRFGFIRKGCIVYNRIPVILFDCFISADGKLHLESDLSKTANVNYWIDNHLFNARSKGSHLLIVGTGFDNQKQIDFDQKQMKEIRENDFQIEYLPTRAAVARFNELQTRENPPAILLKVK